MLTSCQHADKLLGEIESILVASASKSPFPKFKPDISPSQAKVVQDYIARIRAQMIRVLASQGIAPPEPPFGSLHSIRVTLGFAGIAFDECRPEKLRGYGEVPEAAAPELNGLAGEMNGLIGRLDGYLAQGLGQDLEARLERLQREGSDVGLVRRLERIVNAHGLVEFRPALANIIDRLESTSFEIAFFGRVSSGKSSLLNRIVQRDVLPVGVTPVTAVPTRIVYGPEERAIVWIAGQTPENLTVDRLAEFATEQHNPANRKHVTRIVVELPSPRLQDGVVYVDTPGLGSLAAAGAAETLAYLPRCDLGVVLIDAESTLAADDLGTIRTLHQAAIPAIVLVSKSDLLAADDCVRVREYVASHIASELGLDLPIHLVSAKLAHAALLESWFAHQILPLYARHVELSRASVSRKIGALRAAVEAVLQAKLRRPEGGNGSGDAEWRALETDLRTAAGRFAEVRTEGLRITDGIRQRGGDALHSAAAAVLYPASKNGAVAAALERFAAGHAGPLAAMLNDLALACTSVLGRSAAALALGGVPDANEFSGFAKEMPRLDIGPLDAEIRAGRWASARRMKRKLESQVGTQVTAAFSSYGRQLESWFLRALNGMQARFDSYADGYRAQLGRLAGQPRPAPEEAAAIRRDLKEIGSC
ncbi:MAG: dynamin family protein [Bryobacteraceae bacterium]